mmetsp:Transcript_142001/g.258104  ORF Transcript_142001/g.258104 Transcript_142001/m.258104 type:complete len:81 (-) Transcript_142001:23-265(-)
MNYSCASLGSNAEFVSGHQSFEVPCLGFNMGSLLYFLVKGWVIIEPTPARASALRTIIQIDKYSAESIWELFRVGMTLSW